jgi:hypothetical protein
LGRSSHSSSSRAPSDARTVERRAQPEPEHALMVTVMSEERSETA